MPMYSGYAGKSAGGPRNPHAMPIGGGSMKQPSGSHKPAPPGKRMAPHPKAPAPLKKKDPHMGKKPQMQFGNEGLMQPKGTKISPTRRQKSASEPHSMEGLNKYLRGKEF